MRFETMKDVASRGFGSLVPALSGRRKLFEDVAATEKLSTLGLVLLSVLHNIKNMITRAGLKTNSNTKHYELLICPRDEFRCLLRERL